MLANEVPAVEWSPLQQQLQETSAFFSQLVLAPALQHELNTYGFSKPKRLAAILDKSLTAEDKALKITLPAPSENQAIELWHFDRDSGLNTRVLDITSETYEQLNELATYTGDLRKVSEAPHECIEQLFQGEQRSLINIPMKHQGTHVATLHLATPSAHALGDNDLLLAQTFAQMLTPAFANYQLQNKVAFSMTRQRHLLVHYKGLHKVLQQTREAYEQSEENVTKLKQLCQTLKARAWENQERCAALEKQLKRAQREQMEQKERASSAEDTTTVAVAEAEPEEAAAQKPAEAAPKAPANIALPSPSKASAAPPPDEIQELIAQSNEKASQEAGNLLREIASSTRSDTNPAPSPYSAEDSQELSIDIVNDALMEMLDVKAPPAIPEVPSLEIPDTAETQDELSIEDFEIEEELTAVQGAQTLLYLSSTPLLPQLSFFEALQSMDVQPTAAHTVDDLLTQIDDTPPMAVALLSLEQSEYKQQVERGLQGRHLTTKLPIFDVQTPKDQEALIRLRWGMYQTRPLRDRFWRGWINQIHRPHAESDSILSIGFPDEKACAPLLHFFCGHQLIIRAYQNPVDGVQSLYQSPPQLLALQLGNSAKTWVPLFKELSSSLRTKEVPLLLLSPGPLDPALQEAIQPFQHIILTPKAKLA